MGKLTSDLLDEYSLLMTGHEGWGFLDQLTTHGQLDVIQNYNDNQKYIVVVFEIDNRAKKHYERSKKLDNFENKLDEIYK